MRHQSVLRVLLALAAFTAAQVPAAAQATVFGVDVRIGQSFVSDTGDFVNNYLPLAAESRLLYGIDFDATGSTLYAIDNTTREIVTIDTTTGLSAPTGNVATGITGLSGLTAATDGVTWYVSEFDGVTSRLYTGNILTGAFTLVGPIASGIIVDISIDAQGDLYGLNITDDSLYSIDTTTGAGSLVGPLGLPTNFAQGMDFDWVTNTLVAAIYTGGGGGALCTIDVATGAATVLFDTTTLNAEMEIAIPASGSTSIGTNYCSANANSTGMTGVTTADGSIVATSNDVTLTASRMPNAAFGYFLASPTQGFIISPGGSSGNLCLAGTIGRYVGPGQILNTGLTGAFSLVLDLTQMPSPTGPVAVQAGDTWNFTAWHRDSLIGQPVSNFTDGLSITFQ